MQELWCPVPIDGYRDLYEISSIGRVRRLTEAFNCAGKCYPKGHVLAPRVDKDGYHEYGLRDASGKRRFFRTHRLVALAFLGAAPSRKHQVAHYDGDPANNTPANLRWATCKENMRDRDRHGRTQRGDTHSRRLRPEIVPRGEDNAAAKLTEQTVREIRQRYAAGGCSHPSLGKEYGVSHSTIGRVVRREKWAHVS